MEYQPERTLREKIELAARVEGLDGLELCYPADFSDLAHLKTLLGDHGLGVAAVNFRSRRSGRWWRGSFSSESTTERDEVVEDLWRAMDLARELGCFRVTTCPLNDGHDYVFEMDYVSAYAYAAEAFVRACAHDSSVNVCIEYKWSDPRVRCLFGNAGETLSFCQTTGMPNLGVTLDFGHSRYAGERPALAACLLAQADRLFYVHLNDNDGQWDWDMIPGAYNLWEFVEFFHYLGRLGYDEDWYACDVFPKEIDTTATFSAVTAVIRKLEQLAGRLDWQRIAELQRRRDPTQVITYLYSLL